MTVLPLRAGTLARLDRRVRIPTYDRAALRPGVVHISVGSFHRAHQAVYFDDLAQRGISMDWGILGVGLRRPEMQDVLIAQDGLYTLVERGSARDRPRVVGSICRYLFAPQHRRAVVAALADPRIRLVTLTITGAAYHIDAETRDFLPTGDVLAEIDDPSRPRTAIGYLVEGLALRRALGRPGLTVLSCDNLPDNGPLTRRAVVCHAALRDPSLAAWIEANVAFPSSMVDRITPQTTPDDRRHVEDEFGIADLWPVVCEPYSQWIVEDAFLPRGRPPLEAVGVQFVGDVRPYSLHKTRLLNASHCALGYLGGLAGLDRIDETMAEPPLAGYIARVMAEEIAPLLPSIPGVDLDVYQEQLLERFANPKIADRLDRLRRNGSAKMPCHVLSSLAAARASGRPHAGLTLAVAGWIRSLLGVDELGQPLPVDDPEAARLQALAREGGGTDPRPLLADRRLFGSLADDACFGDDLEAMMAVLERDGVRATLARYCGDPLMLAA